MFRPVRIFICFLILTVSCAEHPFDFVENAFYNVVNWKADPCDDFYRHACYRSDYKRLVIEGYSNVIKDVRYQRSGENWKK
ncbi:hypothetical protein L5515_018131 [Caenorhabditis briggsae]|uniref:Uncharacterized protein n=1 Tax=Caenorhabditis briggsae TaxID=6238 RepID=A0AAE9FFN6_CAEBR|nr:hypothetical protein L5515_018131 [Caenorhabditis briggsae]